NPHRVHHRRRPVKLGLVSSLARPRGNLTGVNYFGAEVVSKRLQLLRELVPRIGRLAVLVNLSNAAISETTVRDAAGARDRAFRLRRRDRHRRAPDRAVAVGATWSAVRH